MFQQIRIECFDVSKIGFQTHGTTAVGLAAAKMASSCAGVSVFKVQTWPRYRRYRHWLGVDGNVIRYAVMGWPTPWQSSFVIQISADPLAHNWPHICSSCLKLSAVMAPKTRLKTQSGPVKTKSLEKLWRVNHPKFEPNLTTEAANCHSPWQMGLPKLGLSRTPGPCPSCSVTWHPSRWDQPLWVKAVQNLQTVQHENLPKLRH